MPPLIKPGSEDEIQASFFRWVDTAFYQTKRPELDLIFAIPNAGFSSIKQGVLRKLTGRKAGVPDVCLPAPSHDDQFPILWIEFKRPGEKPSPEQRAWIHKLRAAGHRVEVYTSWVDGANLVIEHLALPLKPL